MAPRRTRTRHSAALRHECTPYTGREGRTRRSGRAACTLAGYREHTVACRRKQRVRGNATRSGGAASLEGEIKFVSAGERACARRNGAGLWGPDPEADSGEADPRSEYLYKVLSYSELMGDYFGAIFTGFMGRW